MRNVMAYSCATQVKLNSGDGAGNKRCYKFSIHALKLEVFFLANYNAFAYRYT